eukprot:1161189-Pelagomonas_calceolata.AAC.11
MKVCRPPPQGSRRGQFGWVPPNGTSQTEVLKTEVPISGRNLCRKHTKNRQFWAPPVFYCLNPSIVILCRDKL